MKKYFEIYKQFISSCFAESTSYRLNFWLLIIMDIILYLIAFFTVDFIYDHLGTIGQWNRDNFLFFISFILCVNHLHMTFVSENFWEFSFHLRNGTFDFILLKPISPIFNVFFRIMRPSTIWNFLLLWPLLIYYGLKSDLSILSWISLPFLVLCGFALMVALELILASFNFWIIDGWGTNFLRMQFQSLSRWPDFVFVNPFKRIFSFFMPFLIIGSGPVQFLLDNSNWVYLIYMIFSFIGSVIVFRFIWNKGLNQYESASS